MRMWCRYETGVEAWCQFPVVVCYVVSAQDSGKDVVSVQGEGLLFGVSLRWGLGREWRRGVSTGGRYIMLNYEEMTVGELVGLDRRKTIFLMAVSPLEVHGPHLPVGTDVIIAEALLERYSQELQKEYPDFQLVKLPSLYAGSTPVPAAGSIAVKASRLEGLLFDTGKGLAEQGFHYLFLADNHGGPGHQLAIEAASRKLYKKKGFYLINPFNLVYRYMVNHEDFFMEMIEGRPGECGDDADSHAGTNETSLYLCVRGEEDNIYTAITPSLPPEDRGFSSILKGLSRLLKGIGAKTLSQDLVHLANTLGWINDPEMKPYMGIPAKASKEAGERMLAARVEIALKLFKKALAGERVETRPLLWSLRFLRWFV